MTGNPVPDSVAVVSTNDPTVSTDLGDGWYEVSIPFSAFSNNGADVLATHLAGRSATPVTTARRHLISISRTRASAARHLRPPHTLTACRPVTS